MEIIEQLLVILIAVFRGHSPAISNGKVVPGRQVVQRDRYRILETH